MSGSLLLAQAQSNRGPRGRKKDFIDAERLVKRLVALELETLLLGESPRRRIGIEKLLLKTAPDAEPGPRLVIVMVYPTQSLTITGETG